MITQAFVLGAGLGTRLRPLTNDFPKPLIPIFQKPLITFPLDHLISAGINSFVINTHHCPEHFVGIFGNENSSRATYRDHQVTFRHEPVLLGTGGGIKNVEDLFSTEPFIVYSGDLLTDFSLAPVIEAHSRDGNDVTLALRRTGLATSIALKNKRILDIENKYGHPGEYDFANVSIWNRSIFERIPPGKSLSFIPIVADWIGKGGKIGGVVLNDGEWFNIGSRTEYIGVHRFIQTERWKPKYIMTDGWPTQIASDAEVDPTAHLSGFYSIGARSRVGANAILENTILWPGAEIASRSRLRNCIVRSDRKIEGEHHDGDI